MSEIVDGLNEAEEFVYKICKKSFLSLWSYANPHGKNNNELCDILVVCEPDIIILSVKNIKLSDGDDFKVSAARWLKKAVDESVDQIYGAEKWINNASNVVRKDGTLGVQFPSKSGRNIHRIAVALGSEGKIPLSSKDFGKGFTHIFDELSFKIVMNELNTITDFVTYLMAKEKLWASKDGVIVEGGEENLLAFYLFNNRTFPDEGGLFIMDNTLWEGFIKEPQLKAKKIADEDSYVWDNLIEIFCQDTLQGSLEFDAPLTESELSVRVLSREDRFTRRVLGREFLKFVQQTKSRSTVVPSPSGVMYVYLLAGREEDRKYRVAEMAGRCFVVRGLFPKSKTVIGICTEKYQKGGGFSLDLFYFHKDLWTLEDMTQVNFLQSEFGYFKNSVTRFLHEDEYPE